VKRSNDVEGERIMDRLGFWSFGEFLTYLLFRVPFTEEKENDLGIWNCDLKEESKNIERLSTCQIN